MIKTDPTTGKILNPFEALSLRDASYSLSPAIEKILSEASEEAGKEKIGSKTNTKAEATVVHGILSEKSRKLQKRQVSQRIILARRAKLLPILCEETGITSLLEVPLIPGLALTYQHPLSILENARGIAQQGRDYLEQLDTTVLAGILLRIAEPYSLFRASPDDTAVQKNAILRTAGKPSLIHGILFVETLVHSRNSRRIPSFSLELSKEVKTDGIEGRFIEWLKLAAEAVKTPEHDEYDEAKQLRERRTWIRENNKRLSTAEEISKAKAKKAWNADKKEAKPLIIQMFKAKQISAKLKGFLLIIFDGDFVATADETLIGLVITKLRDMDNAVAEKLARMISAARASLKDDSDPFGDDPLEEAKDFASMPIGTYMDSPSAEQASATEASIETPVKTILPANSIETVEAAAPMSFIEKLKAKKAAEKAAKEQENNNDF
ncbi:MAG: hypothetical protein AB7F19_07510 [Candidatus Babeliales bacterium]